MSTEKEKMPQEKMTSANTVLLVIDVDEETCHPDALGNPKTAAIAQKIPDIVAAFKNKSVPVCAFYIDHGNPFSRNYDPMGTVKPYLFQPTWEEIYTKRSSSAFDKPLHDYKTVDLAAILKNNGIKNIILCGFNRHACIRATADDGLAHQFNVVVLDDLTANNRMVAVAMKREYATEESQDRQMKDKGIVFKNSQDMLAGLAS